MDFGTDVRNIVDGVTKLGKVGVQVPRGAAGWNHRKMLTGHVYDIHVILVKLADRYTICVNPKASSQG